MEMSRHYPTVHPGNHKGHKTASENLNLSQAVERAKKEGTMAYVRPEEVIAPQDRWKLTEVLHNGGEDRFGGHDTLRKTLECGV